MLACQALDFKDGKKPGKGVYAAYKLIRKFVPFVEEDQILYPYVLKIKELIASGQLVREVEKVVGNLS